MRFRKRAVATGLVGLLGAVSLAGGWVLARQDRDAALASWQARLGAMRDDRALAIESWLGERAADADALAAVTLPPRSHGEVTRLLATLARTYGYLGAGILGADGAPLAWGPDGAPPAALSAEAAGLRRAGRGRRVAFFRADDGSVQVTVLAVPASGPPDGARPVVALVLDPAVWLYPLLAREPVPTATAECLLVTRDRGDVVFLNPLRHRSAPPLTVRARFDSPRLAGRLALTGPRVTGEFDDYRGVEVLAATTPIQGAPWGLVVKVDRSEALAHHRRTVGLATLAVTGLLAALCGVAYGAFRRERESHARDVALRDRRYRRLVEQARDAILVVHPGEGRILEANPAAERVYGRDAAGLRGLSLADLRAPAESGSAGPLAAPGTRILSEEVHLRSDGSPFPVEVSESAVELDGDSAVLVAIVRDVSERKAGEHRIEHLNRLLLTLSGVNELIVREKDRERLLQRTCDILVERGRFALAWIGDPDEPTGLVQPLVASGAVAYLGSITIRYDTSDLGRGPTGTAVREGRPTVRPRWDSAAEMAPWRRAGLAHGFQSSAAIPLSLGPGRRGALTVYATEPDFFEPDVVSLLGELAGDVGFALAALASEEARIEAEGALAAEHERTRHYLEVAGVLLVAVDLEGRVTLINRRGAEIVGWPAQELVGRDWIATCIPEESRQEVADVFARLLRGEVGPAGRHESEVRRRDGKSRRLAFDHTLLRGPDGTVAGVLTSAEDVTEVRRMERELREANDELERRVEERTRQLTEANRELEAFSYSVSHDLRAPLRAVDGYARLLETRCTAALDEEGKRLLAIVRESARRMGQLIDDLLSLSRVGRQTLRRERIDMGALVAATFGELAPPGALPTAHLELGPLPDAEGDTGLVRQVVVNLVSNALKFSGTRPLREVRVEGAAEGERASYAVQDNGVGFDGRYVHKLFGVFQRLHGSTEFEGTGVGLALVRRIVERHGGTVGAESREGSGATFRFTLPRWRPAGDVRAEPGPGGEAR